MGGGCTCCQTQRFIGGRRRVPDHRFYPQGGLYDWDGHTNRRCPDCRVRRRCSAGPPLPRGHGTPGAPSGFFLDAEVPSVFASACSLMLRDVSSTAFGQFTTCVLTFDHSSRKKLPYFMKLSVEFFPPQTMPPEKPAANSSFVSLKNRILYKQYFTKPLFPLLNHFHWGPLGSKGARPQATPATRDALLAACVGPGGY